MRIPARSTTLAVALVCALCSSSAQAAPVPDAPDRYGEAQQLLEADDFVGAAEIWESLLEETPESADTYSGREAMIINAIDARMEAYRRQVTADGSREPLNLVAAQVALRRYLRAHVRAYGQDRALSVPVQQRAATLAMMLAETEPAPPPPSSAPAERPAAPPPARPPAPERGNGNGLLVGGIGLGVLGLSVGLTMIPLGAALGRNAENIYTVSVINASNTSDDTQRALYLADAREAERAGRTSNRVAIAGGVLSPVLMGTAAAMIVLGLQRRNASWRQGPRVSPDYAGWEATYRF
ncbi:MAG: hypothetical protein ACE37F_08100 [Nannocystaceae bacterium]|nr:hypothetical protein [bacterium]